MKKQNFIILGAGYAGLSCAALLAQQGHRVQLLEAHRDLGGCAGRFRRRDFLFDAGATTLSGIAHNGPLKTLIQQLQLDFELKSADPGLVIRTASGKVLKRHQDVNMWIKELERHFPELEHHKLWHRIEKINREAWKLLPHLSSFPPKKPSDLVGLIRPQLLKGSLLAPYLLKSFEDLLDQKSIEHQEFKQMLDEMLMISTQSHTSQVNALIGCLGASYLADTWIPMGGMSALGDLLLEKFKAFGGEIEFNQRVTNIEAENQGFKILTHKEKIFHATHVISTLPMWNHLEIGPSSLKKEVHQYQKDHPHAWGAICAYGSVKFERPLDGQYFQIHTPIKMPYASSSSLFISFSHSEDRKRAPKGFHAFSASVHTHEDQWPYQRGTTEYKEQKEEFKKAFVELFNREFDSYSPQELGNIEVGTPHTFVRYTHRFKGRVGGLPHRGLKTLLTYPSHLTSVPNFYRIGDTVFPGQGVVGVIAGAQNLVKQFKKGQS